MKNEIKITLILICISLVFILCCVFYNMGRQNNLGSTSTNSSSVSQPQNVGSVVQPQDTKTYTSSLLSSMIILKDDVSEDSNVVIETANGKITPEECSEHFKKRIDDYNSLYDEVNNYQVPSGFEELNTHFLMSIEDTKKASTYYSISCVDPQIAEEAGNYVKEASDEMATVNSDIQDKLKQ